MAFMYDISIVLCQHRNIERFEHVGAAAAAAAAAALILIEPYRISMYHACMHAC